MESFNYIIVEVESDYNNEKRITDDISIVVNTTIESVEHINRKAKVISAPDFTILKSGDEVIIHHNICRLRNGVKGKMVNSDFWIEDKKYFVPLTEVFMYKRGDDDWKAIAPYCFVEPIKYEDNSNSLIKLIDTSETHKGMIRNIGFMRYSNQILNDYNINDGDLIAFSDNSEYEFIIDNKLYYKMSVKDILGKIE